MFRFLHDAHRFHAMHGHHHGGGGRERGEHGDHRERAGGAYTPSPGAIYPLLALLVDMGHVSAAADGNKKLHTITPEGEAFLAENRQFVDAIMARMNEPDGGRDDLRTVMHQLKHVVISKAHDGSSHPARLERIREILRAAAASIDALE